MLIKQDHHAKNMKYNTSKLIENDRRKNDFGFYYAQVDVNRIGVRFSMRLSNWQHMHAMMNCSFLNTINRLHNTTGSEIKSIIMRNIERNIVVGVVFHTLANAISFDFQPLFMREFMKILSDHKTRTDDQREIRFHRFKRPYQIHKINSNAGNSMSIKKRRLCETFNYLNDGYNVAYVCCLLLAVLLHIWIATTTTTKTTMICSACNLQYVDAQNGEHVATVAPAIMTGGAFCTRKRAPKFGTKQKMNEHLFLY